jgi:DNA polymerase III alpha subunit (gram-positive type)
MKKITYIIIALAIVIGGYTYYANQQAKEVARVEAVKAEKAAAEAAAQVAAEKKAAEEAAAKAVEEAAAKAAEEAAAEAKRVAEEAAAKAAEEAAAAAKAVEEAAAKAAEEAAAEAKRVAEEAAAKAAEEAAAAAKAVEEAAAKAAEEAAAKAAEEAAAAKAAEEAAAAKAAEEAAAAKAAEEAAAAAEAAAAEAAAAEPMMMPPFGSEGDVGFAGKIWAAMLDQNLAGPDMLRAAPYEGTDPHGMMLELFTTKANIDGREGDLIVKRNFGPVGVTADQVLENPEKHLGAITVMFRREAGYDEDTKNWFWVKFLPDGSVDKNPKGLSLAGKVAKGMDVGCIACHSAADGDDFVYSPGVFE